MSHERKIAEKPLKSRVSAIFNVDYCIRLYRGVNVQKVSILGVLEATCPKSVHKI
jgi:hypothetical protein